MIKNKKKIAYLKKTLKDIIEESLNERFNYILNDISYRLTVLQDNALNTGAITSNKLNLKSHILDGFVFTDQSPGAGSIAWTDCHIIYAGINYDITSGSTAMKYIWWKCGTAAEKITFQTSNTKPIVADQDAMICINEAGVHNLIIGQGNMLSGAILLDGTVKSAEIGANAVQSTHVLDSAITLSKVATGAVDSTKLTTGAVTSTKLGAGAVDSTALGANAVTAGKINASAVDSTALASNAVTTSKIADSAITNGKIGSLAVDSGKIADSAVTISKIGNGAVDSTKLADGSVISTKILGGSVLANKLNVAYHMLS